MDMSQIRENMGVVASDGRRVGQVTALETDRLGVRPLGGTGAPGYVPLDWISRIDEHVHLRHDAAVVAGAIGGIPEPAPRPTEGRLTGPMVIGAIFLVIAIGLLIWALFFFDF